MTELKLHDIEFSDLELQGGDGGGEVAIQLNPKKRRDDENDDNDNDSDNDSDDTDSSSREDHHYSGGDNQDDDDDDDNDDDDDDDDDDHDNGDYDHQIGGAGPDGSDDGDEPEDVGQDGGGISEDDTADIDNFKKFNQQLKMSYVTDTHPEAESHNHDEVHAFATVVRDAHGVIIDPLHKTIPILTKYEKTRILGMRTKQINDGAEPYIKLPATPVPIIDGYVIAQRELEEKKLPFIIRRPLPNGGTEYWYLQDLEIL
jgi:DNA-directed RNA polymerase subunit K/omega